MSIAELFPEAKRRPAPTERCEVRYTVVTSDRPIAKRFTAVAGEPKKLSGDATLISGTADTFVLAGTASEMAAGLAKDLKTLTEVQVLICAPPPPEQKSWPLVTDSKVESTPGAIARTTSFFPAPAGPALFGLDFDVKDFPANVMAKVTARLGGLRAALEDVFPAFAEAAEVQRRSMSTGIRHKGTRKTTSETAGLHRFYFIRNGQDSSRFAQVLRDRLLLKGWGWGQVTKSGNILIKTLIDVTASSRPARLWYEGKAILESTDLEFVPGVREPLIREGDLLDTRLLPDLTAAEQEELRRIESAIRDQFVDEAERAKLTHKQLCRGRSLNLDPSAFGAFDEDHTRAVDHFELQGDFPIRLDDGRLVTAREINANPDRYAGATCPDPLEPEYGGGRNIAIVLNGGGNTRIESMAHGGVVYPIRMKVSDFYEKIEAQEEPATKTAEAPRVIAPTPFVWRDPGTITPRQWLYGDHYIRGFVSTTVAPGGLGKSSLNMVENMAMATKRPLLGIQPHGRFVVWVWNGEDPFEEIERRVHAAMLFYGIDRSELEGRFYFDSGRLTPITIARQTRDGATIHEPDVKALKAAVKERGIDVLTIDPFVSSHRITENDNDAMALAARAFAQVADETNISVELVHHVRKLNGREVTIEDSRGGGSLVDAARANRTLARPNSDEMRRLGLTGDPRTYFRFAGGKDNMTAPATGDTKWMVLRSQNLGNGTPQYPAGDSIGVVASYTPTGATELAGSDQVDDILRALASGEYRDHANAGDSWSGNVVASVMGLDAGNPEHRPQITEMINSLKACKRIRTVHRNDPVTRKMRWFVQVCEPQKGPSDD